MATGEPEVHRQRGKWVVRVSGYDPATGRRRMRQLGTFTSRRAAVARQRELVAGGVTSDSGTLGEFLEEAWLGLRFRNRHLLLAAKYTSMRPRLITPCKPLRGREATCSSTVHTTGGRLGWLENPRREGLPVLVLGRTLRVPRHALERLLAPG